MKMYSETRMKCQSGFEQSDIPIADLSAKYINAYFALQISSQWQATLLVADPPPQMR